MHYFHFKKGELYCEDVSVQALRKKYGTPLFVYSQRTIAEHYRKLQRAFGAVRPLICYSVKANSNVSILKLLIKQGAGLDIVSGGELYRAITAGCNPRKIVYASVGKTDDEIAEAIRKNIFFFNVESLSELENIDVIAKRLHKKVNVALRINPDIEPKTHKFITTGKLTNKFGIDFDSAWRIFKQHAKFKNVCISGVHIHIGSQITESGPYLGALKKIIRFIERLKKIGVCLSYLNIGGGLGIVYNREKPQTADAFAKKVLPLLKKTKLKIIMEPGRFIVGSAGILVARVLYVKKTPLKKFIVVDGAMNDLIRPSLYSAYHTIIEVDTRKDRRRALVRGADVVGPICETADCLGKKRSLRVKKDDCLAVLSAGAYGFSMSSNYNSRGRAAEVLVSGKKARLIRARETYSDLVAKEIRGL